MSSQLESESPPTPSRVEQVPPGSYLPATEDGIAQQYLEFLQRLEEAQNSRLQTIEGKIAQLIAQSSIVVSIAALFIPLISDKFIEIPTTFLVVVILIFGVILGIFLHSIYKSCETLIINNFKFSRQSVDTITKTDRPTVAIDFVNQQNADLVYILRNNEEIINKKATSLIKAAKSFRLAIILLGFFTIAVSLFLINGKEPEKVVNQNINLYIDDSIHKYLIHKYQYKVPSSYSSKAVYSNHID